MKNFLLLLFIIPFVSFAQNDSLRLDEKLQGKVGIEVQPSTSPDKPLYFIEGKLINESEVKKINPDDIESINILKDEKAIEKYGDEGKNGVIEIKLKVKNGNVSISDKPENHISQVGILSSQAVPEMISIDSIYISRKQNFPGMVCQASVRTTQDPLYVIDGEITNLENISIPFIKENIESIIIIKGNEAISKYGQKGKYGVIEIQTMNGKGITQYDLTVLDLGYESFLAMQPSAMTYSLNYLENKNRRYVSIWNQRVISGNREIYEMPIDYDARTFYGLDFEYKLYMFFKFMEDKYQISFT